MTQIGRLFLYHRKAALIKLTQQGLGGIGCLVVASTASRRRELPRLTSMFERPV
jgi:hypothetical protein